jgi:hypothetical protein
VLVLNSAAQVSTRLNTGRMPSAWRRARTSFSGAFEQVGEAPVGKSLALEHAQPVGIDLVEAAIVQLHLELDDFLDLREEPGIDSGQPVHLLEREAALECVADVPDPLGAGLAELALDRLAVGGALVQAVDARLRARAAPSGTIPGTCVRSP